MWLVLDEVLYRWNICRRRGFTAYQSIVNVFSCKIFIRGHMDLLLANGMWTIKSGASASGRLFRIRIPKSVFRTAVLAARGINIPGHIGKGFELSAIEDKGRYQT